jgi:hypothetical protein
MALAIAILIKLNWLIQIIITIIIAIITYKLKSKCYELKLK